MIILLKITLYQTLSSVNLKMIFQMRILMMKLDNSLMTNISENFSEHSPVPTFEDTVREVFGESDNSNDDITTI